MNNLNLSYWFCFLIVLITVSCSFNQKASSPFEDFYLSFEKQTEKEVLFTFENTKEDSLSEFYFMLEDVLKLLQSNVELNDTLESHNIYRDTDKFYILIKAVHRHLNGKEVQFDKLVKEIKDYLKDIAIYEKDLSECYFERLKIARTNFETLDIGNILNLSYPVRSEKDGKTKAFYYGCSPGYDSDEANYLLVKGELIQKDSIVSYDESINLFFKLKITSLSDSNTSILLEKVNIGDTLKVDLNSYGRLISPN